MNVLSGESEWEDRVSPAELNLWEAIQDLLIDRYNQRGIVIEACPTSNLYIGRFHHYREHPVFRWSPPKTEWLSPGERFNRFGLRNGCIKVCLNTDDSGLMPTTIANEHRIIEMTAREDYDVGARDAELWIDQIRQDGVKIFQDSHLQWVFEN
ncbi:hypothetical protein GCM10023116_09120 [Kistimonas scapharcae]|uniref:Adenosine deaminase domain-containing protein n=2 Tax=Kistimonas scapharcae TaxID=1036133 RepID=A0ABP8UYE8_9GAMM